jgi:SAM-dependent methyltransferase
MLPALIKAPPRPIGELDVVVEMLVDVTGRGRDEISLQLRREQRHLGISVGDAIEARGIAPYEWSERLAEFYTDSDAFLFETLVYNSTASKDSLRRWIANFLQKRHRGPQRILFYGDGLGFDAAHLARCGHRTSYFEIGKPCIEFARRVFDINDVNVDIYDRPEALPNEAFDIVVCLDVLEHVPDPRALVRELAGYLRPGGRLIVHAPFWYIHRDVKTHLRSNVRFSGDWRTLYQPAGLRPVDSGFLWCPIVLEKGDSARPDTLAAWLRLTISSWILQCSRVSTIPLVTIAKWFFTPKPGDCGG